MAVVSAHEMTEFVWDASLRDMPLSISFPRATLADCIVKSMDLSPAQLGCIHLFSGSIAPSGAPTQISRSLCQWMDAIVREGSREWSSFSDVREEAWPHALPSLIREWHSQAKHVQWIAIGTLGNVALALSSSHSCEHPDSIVSACHQVSAADALVTEHNVKLDAAAFATSLELAQTLNKPLLLLLLNTSGYFCQWLAASSAECSTMDLRCFHSSM